MNNVSETHEDCSLFAANSVATVSHASCTNKLTNNTDNPQYPCESLGLMCKHRISVLEFDFSYFSFCSAVFVLL